MKKSGGRLKNERQELCIRKEQPGSLNGWFCGSLNQPVEPALDQAEPRLNNQECVCVRVCVWLKSAFSGPKVVLLCKNSRND